MHFPLGVAIAILPLGALSQIVTITQRPSACTAIYTSRSSSVVQSTVTVAPIPFSDALVNGGTPFVIEVQVGTAARRRQSESSKFINASGRTTTNASEAVAYRILNGTLQSTAGGYISTDSSSDSALFAISNVAKAISTTFFSRNLQIGWNNTAFAGGACEFYTTATEDGDFDVIAYFRGIVDASWQACTFAIKPAGGLVLEPTTSTVSTTPAVSTSTIDVSVPTPTGFPTENGYCGTSAGVCDGVIFGACCSQYGACGNTDEYCGAGCVPEFGVCNPVIASSSVVAGVSSAAPTPPAYSATAPQPATSSVAVSSAAPIVSTRINTSTSIYLSTSGSVIVTMTTAVPVTTSLPIYSVPGTPIGPVNPPAYSSSNVAVSSAPLVSSPGLPPSYQATPTPATSTFVGISSVPVVSIPSSVPVSISVPGPSSVVPSSAIPTAVITSAIVPPAYTSPDAVPSSIAASSPAVSIISSVPVVVSSSSIPIPLPSFFSSPAAPISSIASSVEVPPIYSTDAGSVTSIAVIDTPTSTPVPDTYPTTESVPALPTEESLPPVFSTTFTPEIATSTALPTELPPVYSETPIAPIPSPTPLPEPVFSSTPVPETYPTTTSTDDTPSSTSVFILPSPTRCDFGTPVDYGADDDYCEIVLPQPMVLYDKSSVNTFASTNGFLSVIYGSTQYENAATLPTTQVTEADNSTPLTALFPFWDDLSIPEGESDYGIYYQLSDTGVTYEYYLTRTGQLVLFHFTVEYEYANPGVAVFTYYEMDDPGVAATVGSQGFDATGTAVGALYSYQSGLITTGLVVTCDTLANTCVETPSAA